MLHLFFQNVRNNFLIERFLARTEEIAWKYFYLGKSRIIGYQWERCLKLDCEVFRNIF